MDDINNIQTPPVAQPQVAAPLSEPPGIDALVASTQAPPGIDELVADDMRAEKYGSMAQQAITGLEGAASAATFGLSTGLETALGVDPKDIQGRREENPVTHAVGQGAGLVGTLAIPGVGAANALTKAGVVGAEALGIVEGATVLSKIGSTATKAAIENMVFQGGDEVSKMFSQDPNQTVGTAAADIGLSGLIGGGIGSAAKGTHELWKATMGGKLDTALKGVASKLGGIEGHLPDTISDALERSGLDKDMAPEIKAVLRDDPMIKNLASTLEQTDTNASGRAFQESAKNFRESVGKSQAEALGVKYDDLISKGDIDKYSAGRDVGETLAKEIDARVKPLSEGYNMFKDAYKKVDLAENSIKDVAEKISQRAIDEGWALSPSGDIMKEVNRVLKELPNVKRLDQLDQYIKQVGENTASKLPFGMQDPVSRAGGIIKSILRETEGDTLLRLVGEKNGADVAAKYEQLRRAYSEAAKLKDKVADTVGLRASTSGYAKALKAMAASDGEKIIQRLSGKGDAAWLDLVQKQFPETASKIKAHVINELVAKSTKDGVISSAKLMSALDNMSPQLRKFALPEEALSKVKASSALLKAFNDVTHNHSNTARTVDKLLGHLPGAGIATAVGLVTSNPALAGLAGYLTKHVGKDIPDAVRLSMLKFLGSSQPINAAKFKAMVEMVDKVQKGHHDIQRGVKRVFDASREVIPAHIPTDTDRKRLDKELKALQADPMGLSHVGQDVGHYMPDVAQSMAMTSANAVNYLNNLRPAATKANPLDADFPPSADQVSKYNRALDVAIQPLSVLNHIKAGTLQTDDIQHLAAMYPDLYKALQAKLMDQVVTQTHKGHQIPFHSRLSLGLFVGKPLDSTMTPEAIMAAQPMPQDNLQSAPQGKAAKAPSESSMKGISKLASSYQTPNQTREQRQQKV